MAAESPPTPRPVEFPTAMLDVFARAPLQGNLLLVVERADSLSSETMAVLARRTRLSETSFVQSAAETGADYRHRIFTASGEIPFAGHPSLGTAAAVVARSGRQHGRVVQETLAGNQAIEVSVASDGQSAEVVLSANAPEFLEEPDPGRFLAALGLGSSDQDGDLPASVVSTGLATLLLPLAGMEALGRAVPDPDRLAEAFAGLATEGVITVYAATRPEGRGSSWRARCFTPSVVGTEDAATGSAAGPLAAFAARRLQTPRIEVVQGVEMGCPSYLSASCQGDEVLISGEVQLLGTGTIRLPV